MCTASWLIHPDGFELFFNRDEARTRGIARPPERLELGGIAALAPIDADAGGTWIGVNARGLAVGLLNAQDARAEPGGRSRGLLVRELLAAPDVRAALALLEREPLERYRAFTLALFAPDAAPLARAWDGRELRPAPARAPLCSSSLDGGRALTERARLYARLVPDPSRPAREQLRAFQASHEPERGPWSPCMHRREAHTVSATEVRVTGETVSVRYAPGAPCTASFGDWLELERAR